VLLTKKILILCLAFFYCNASFGTQPLQSTLYDAYSQNGEYYFKSIPHTPHGLNSTGETIVYRTAGNKELYRIDAYCPSGFITNDGQHIYSTFSDVFISYPLDSQKVMLHYFKDEKITDYYLHSFGEEWLSIEHFSNDIYFWNDGLFIDQDTIHILTKDYSVIRIDARTGKLVDHENENYLISKYDLKRISFDSIVKFSYNETYQSFSYENNSFPNGKIVSYKTIDSVTQRYILRGPGDENKFKDPFGKKEFKNQLAKFLKMEIAEYDYKKDESFLIVECYIFLDTLGRVTDCSIEAKKGDIINDKISKEIEDWLKAQKFDRTYIPNIISKWQFWNIFCFL